MAKSPKNRRFASLNIRKIAGGRDPLQVVSEFITRCDLEEDKCLQHSSADSVRWMLPLSEGQELEILLEGLTTPSSCAVYMGLNVVTVPIRGAYDLLATALQIADSLVGIKVSLVGHYLVLSASLPAANIQVDELEHAFSLITAQKDWFKETLLQELDWEVLPE